MAEISDADKLGMAALIASTEEQAKKKRKVILPRPRPASIGAKRRKITPADVASGRVSEGDANDELMIQNMRGYKNGGKIDGAVMKGRTRGKMC